MSNQAAIDYFVRYYEDRVRAEYNYPPDQAIRLDDVLHYVLDQPVTLDDLKAVFDFVKHQQVNGVSGVMVFDSGQSGPTLGVSAVTHGNEPAGLASVPALVMLEALGMMQSGKVIFSANNMQAAEEYFAAVKAGDEQAKHAARKARGDSVNMNRLPDDVMEQVDSSSYAIRRAQALKPFWDQYDVGLDLHTTSTKADPMVITHRPPDEKREHLLANMPAVDWITGIYEKLKGNAVPEFYGGPGKPATTATIECGQHEARESADVAQNTVITAMENMGLMLGLNRRFSPALNRLRETSTYNHFHLADEGITAIFHPKADPNFDAVAQQAGLSAQVVQEMKKDSYRLVNLRQPRERAKRANERVNGDGVWQNFEQIGAGEIVAVGEKYGHPLVTPAGGHIIMAPRNPVIPADQAEAIAFITEPMRLMPVKAGNRETIHQWRNEVMAGRSQSSTQAVLPPQHTTQQSAQSELVQRREVQPVVSEPEPELSRWQRFKQGIGNAVRWTWNRATYPVRWGFAKVRGNDAPPVDPEKAAATMIQSDAVKTSERLGSQSLMQHSDARDHHMMPPADETLAHGADSMRQNPAAVSDGDVPLVNLGTQAAMNGAYATRQ